MLGILSNPCRVLPKDQFGNGKSSASFHQLRPTKSCEELPQEVWRELARSVQGVRYLSTEASQENTDVGEA